MRRRERYHIHIDVDIITLYVTGDIYLKYTHSYIYTYTDTYSERQKGRQERFCSGVISQYIL